MTTPELVARMVNTLLEGVGLAAIVWLALRCFKPLNSGTRFAVWFSALAAIVMLPFIGVAPASTPSAVTPKPEFVLPEAFATYLFAAWGLVTSAMLTRLGLSLLHVRRLRRDACELRVENLDPALRDIFTGTWRRVRVLVSDQVGVPAALGFFRPAIVIPAWAMRELPVEELRSILLHELAHLRRWDDWTNLAQKVFKALFFFHPAVWWIESRLSLEREMACDDMVLAEVSSPRAYAASLISLAERVGLGKTVALAQAALGRARHTSLRIAQILDSKRPKGADIWKPVFGFGAAIAAVAFVVTPYAPDLVAFANPEVLKVAGGTLGVPSLPSDAGSGKTAVSAKAKPGGRRLAVSAKRGATQVQMADGAGPVRRASKAITALAKPGANEVQVVLVMQSTQFDEMGAPVFTLTVWQITDKNRQQVQTEIVMHSL